MQFCLNYPASKSNNFGTYYVGLHGSVWLCTIYRNFLVNYEILGKYYLFKTKYFFLIFSASFKLNIFIQEDFSEKTS